MKINDIWPLLEVDSSSGDGYVQRLISSNSSLDLYLAIERPSNRRMFLFAADRKTFKNQRVLASSKGLDIRKLNTESYGAGNQVYQVIVTDAAYNDIFSTLLQDICDRAVQCETQVKAVGVILNRMAEWQHFLMRRSPDGLTPEEQRGLYGELVFLRQLIDAGLIDDRGLAVWTGPSGAEQDFQFGNTGVESKVSLATQNQELVIASERQLDSRLFSRLFVYYLSLSSRVGSGETLVQAVSSVRSMISARFTQELESYLLLAGYLDAHRELYERAGFVVREENCYEVRDEFPRITESELRAGVGKVKYSISVPTCKQFSVTSEEVLEAIRGEP